MDIAKKLREVVTSNFIEIVRTEEDDRQKQSASAFGANAPVTPLEPRSRDFTARRDDAEARARRELEELEAHGPKAEAPAGVGLDAVTPPPADPVSAPEEDAEDLAADRVEDATEEMPASPFMVEPGTEDEEDEEDEALDDTMEGPAPLFAVSSPDVVVTPTEPDEPGFVEAEAEKPTESGAVEFAGIDEEEVVEAESNLEETAPTVTAITEDNIEAVEVIEVVEAEATEVAPVELLETTTAPDPKGYLTGDGGIEFTRLIKDAKLPTVAFSAEQARKLIAALPDELPMRVKRMTMRATLDAVNPNAEIDPQDIVADAMLKRVHIAQFREALGGEIEAVWRGKQEEIVRLRAEISRIEGDIGFEQERQRIAEAACNQQINQYEQVIMFFQTDEAVTQSADKAAEDEGELPPFMRDDSVHKLLKGRGEEPNPALNGETDARRPGRR